MENIKFFVNNLHTCDRLFNDAVSSVSVMVWWLMEQSGHVVTCGTIQAFVVCIHVGKSKPEASVLDKMLNEAAPSFMVI
jgi:Na+/H+ antiporter NhaA